MREKTKEPGVYKTVTSDGNVRYEAVWRDPGGKQKARWFRRFEDARGFRRKLLRDKDTHSYKDPKEERKERERQQQPLGPYFRAFLADAVGLSPSTKATYETEGRLYILPRFEETPIAAIRPQDVRSLIADLTRRGVGTRTIQLCHQALSRVLRQAVVDGLIQANPCSYVDRPKTVKKKLVRVLEPQEVQELANTIYARYRVLVLTCAYAGLRFGEAAALRRSRARILERKIDVVEGMTEVSGVVAFGPLKTAASRRTVSIPAFLADELALHMVTYVGPAAEDPDGMDLLFTTGAGEPVRRTNFVHRAWNTAAAAAKLEPRPTPHDLRHTSAALAIKAGAHPKAIQSRMGHASITTTLNVYGHLFKGMDEQLADDLDAAYREALNASSAESPEGTITHIRS